MKKKRKYYRKQTLNYFHVNCFLSGIWHISFWIRHIIWRRELDTKKDHPEKILTFYFWVTCFASERFRPWSINLLFFHSPLLNPIAAVSHPIFDVIHSFHSLSSSTSFTVYSSFNYVLAHLPTWSSDDMSCKFQLSSAHDGK